MLNAYERAGPTLASIKRSHHNGKHLRDSDADVVGSHRDTIPLVDEYKVIVFTPLKGRVTLLKKVVGSPENAFCLELSLRH